GETNDRRIVGEVALEPDVVEARADEGGHNRFDEDGTATDGGIEVIGRQRYLDTGRCGRRGPSRRRGRRWNWTWSVSRCRRRCRRWNWTWSVSRCRRRCRSWDWA